MKKILVLGASGLLAKPVVKELTDAGFDVTVGGRSAEKLKGIFPGLKAIRVNAFNKDELIAAMQGQEIVYMNFSVEQDSRKSDPQPEREGVANVLEAAKQTGIKRIAYLSSLVQNYEGMNGYRWWAFQIKHDAVKKIKDSGIPYTIFYPSTFMETIPGNMIRKDKLMIASGSVAKMWFIAASDYGRQVANALRKDDGQNQEWLVQGLTGYNWDEAADIFIKHYQKPLKTMKAPVALVKVVGVFNQKANYGWHIMEALNKYPEQFESSRTWNELGKPTVTLEQYAAGLG